MNNIIKKPIALFLIFLIIVTGMPQSFEKSKFAFADDSMIEEDGREEVDQADQEATSEEIEEPVLEIDESLVKGLDFSSGRLIAQGEVDSENVVGEFEDVSILQFETEEEAMAAYTELFNEDVQVEVDQTFTIQDDSELTEVSDVMEEGETPLNELEDALKSPEKAKIAVIDTGSNLVPAVSMLGDDGKDNNGHGDKMINTILEIAPEADIVSIKAIGDDGIGTTSSVYAAIKYAIETGAKVINLSISAPVTKDSKIVEDVILEAINSGITVVGSAGNNGVDAKNYIPGSIKEAVIVGSADSEGNALKTSNTGETVDFLIPSESTSFAAAKVTGYLALNGTLDGVMEYFYQEAAEEPIEEPEENDSEITVLAKYLYVESNKVSLNDTFETVLIDKEADAVLIQDMEVIKAVVNEAGLYEVDLSAPYKKGVAVGDVIDFAFAHGNYDGEEVTSGVTFDSKSKVATIEPSVIDVQDEDFSDIQIQLLIPATYESIDKLMKETVFSIQSPSITSWSKGWLELPDGTDVSDLTLGKKDTAYGINIWGAFGGYADGFDTGNIFTQSYSMYGYDSSDFPGFIAGMDTSSLYYGICFPTDFYGIDNFVLKGNVVGGGEGHTWTYGSRTYNPAIKAYCYHVRAKRYLQPGKTLVQFKIVDRKDESDGTTYIIMSFISTNRQTAGTGTLSINQTSGGYVGLKVKSAEPEPTPIKLRKKVNFSLDNEQSVEAFENWLKFTNGTKGTRFYIYNDKGDYTGKESDYTGKYFHINKSTPVLEDDDKYYSYSTNTVVLEDGNYYLLERYDEVITDTETGEKIYLVNDGTYDRERQDAPDGVVKFTVETDEDGSHITKYTTWEGTFTGDDLTVTYTNQLRVSRVRAHKVDGEGNPIEGVKIAFYYAEYPWDDNLAYNEQRGFISERVTGSDGYTPQIRSMWGREIYAVEVETPYGYKAESIDDAIDNTAFAPKNDTDIAEIEKVNHKLGDPIGILLQKRDKETGKGTAQGNGTLAGAEYIVKYYDNMAASGTPERTWVFKTDSNGLIDLQKPSDYLVSGDELYKFTVSNSTVYGFPIGCITIQETKAPTGYIKDGASYKVFFIANDEGKVRAYKDAEGTVRYGAVNATNELEDLNVVSEETPIKSGVKLSKIDKDLDSANAQGDATLKDAEITIYANEAMKIGDRDYAKDAAILTVKTDANGNAETANDALPVGKYYAKETKASTGYKLNTYWRKDFEITDTNPGNEKILNLTGDKLPEEVIKGGVKGTKLDSELDSNKVQGQATLKNAEITIYNKSAKAISFGGKNVAVNAQVTTVKTDANGNWSVNNLPYGTYQAKETKAPEGYLNNSEYLADFQIRENEKVVDLNSASDKITKPSDKSGWFNTTALINAALEDQVIRADLKFFKVDIDGSKQAYIPFLVERLDEKGNVVDSHVIISDKNGYVDTSDTANRPKAASNVNKLDSYINGKVYTGPLNDEAAKGNIWFGEGSAVTNSKGSLVYAAYKVTELQSENNDIEDILIQEVVTTTDLTKSFTNGKLFQLDNIFVNLIIHPESDLIDESGTTIVSIKKGAEVTDSVRWDHLKVGQKYKLETVIKYEDREGNVTELGRNSIEFTPSKVDKTNTSYGIEDNTVKINTAGLDAKGGTIHAEDYIYALRDGDEILIASHNRELNTERQMLGVPYIHTIASDSKTKDHVGTAEVEASISDIIEYENLPDGRQYIVKGILVDRDTKEVVSEVEQLLRISYRVKEVTKKSDGTYVGPKDGVITMPEFKFDASEFDGRTLVVQEIFIDYDTEEEYIRHDSLTDEDQSVHYIKVGTQAKDYDTNTHTGTVTDDGKVIDTVLIENAIVGQDYTVTGKFVRKDTMEVVSESKPVKVTAEKETFTVDITFELDTTTLAGVSAVAFEYVSHNGVEVGKHEVPEDPGQIINYTKVRTTAVDAETKGHTGRARENAIVTDRVELINLTIDDTYKVIGTLMNKDGSPFMVNNDKPLTVESKEFTATEKNMTMDLAFEFDASDFENVSVVVFEKLIHIGETPVLDEEGNPVTDEEGNPENEPKETPVATHEDPEDEGQTVNFPSGHTNASDSVTKDEVGKVGETEVIVDVVTYENITVGDKLTVKGTLRYKEDFKDKEGNLHKRGDKVLDEEGKEITASNTINPVTSKNGTITLTYNVNSELLRGAKIVVFEDFYSNDALVYSHADLDDENQRIDYPEVKTTAFDKKTGDHVGVPRKETVIIDTVKLSGLLKGQEYTVTGVLMNQVTGDKYIDADGKEVMGEPVTFTAESSKMEIEMVFKFNGSNLEGTTLVVFEDLEHNGVTVAAHHDIHDEKQSVYYPEIGTKAKDTSDDDKIIYNNGKVSITDTVEYKALPKGHYTAVLTVMDKVTKKEITLSDGTPITRTIGVDIVEPNGTFDVVLETDSLLLKDHTLVMFEELYLNGKLVAEHKDIEDEDQTIYAPDTKTTLTSEGKKEITPSKETKFVDIVKYTNLELGREYILSGTLVRKDTKEVIATGETVKFTPKEANGTVEMTFVCDTMKLAGKSVVAFENITYEENGTTYKVVTHEDLNDKDQTVVIRQVPKTGDETNILAVMFILILSALGILILTAKLRGCSDKMRRKNPCN